MQRQLWSEEAITAGNRRRTRSKDAEGDESARFALGFRTLFSRLPNAILSLHSATVLDRGTFVRLVFEFTRNAEALHIRG